MLQKFFIIFQTLFVCAGSVVLLINVNWIFFLPSGIFIFGLILMRMGYMPSGRSLKRLEAASKLILS